MSARKTPLLLRRSPLTGEVHALTAYTQAGGVLRARLNGKHDVTADFGALVCELLLDDASEALPILDRLSLLEEPGEAPGLTLPEQMELRSFFEALRRVAERHNAGPHVQGEAA